MKYIYLFLVPRSLLESDGHHDHGGIYRWYQKQIFLSHRIPAFNAVQVKSVYLCVVAPNREFCTTFPRNGANNFEQNRKTSY